MSNDQQQDMRMTEQSPAVVVSDYSQTSTEPAPSSPALQETPRQRPALAFREPSVRVRRLRAATDAPTRGARISPITEDKNPLSPGIPSFPPTPSQLEAGQGQHVAPENTVPPEEGNPMDHAATQASAANMGKHPHVQSVRPRSSSLNAPSGNRPPPSSWRFGRMKRNPSWMSNNPTEPVVPSSSDDGSSIRASDAEHYPHAVIDLLDVIDPEVATISTLSNVQNSLFVPNFGSYFPSRRTTVDLSRNTIAAQVENAGARARAESRASQRPTSPQPPTPGIDDATIQTVADQGQSIGRRSSAFSLSGSAPSRRISVLSHETQASVQSQETLRGEYAVLPDDLDWSDWTEEEKAELDDYVRHLLHSRKERLKRSWKGFLKYGSTPLGLFVTIYATLITLWGAAWVLFLIGWIYVGDRQDYIIEVIDQVLTALFCVVGIGMAPFRAVDTYHMIYIAMYHNKTVKLWKKQGKELKDKNDLPHDDLLQTRPVAEKHGIQYEESPLTKEEYAKFIHHQAVFCKSHTFYKPHETFTHRAFRLDLMIVIVCLLDFHSIFQMALGGTTWGIYYKDRPKEVTAIILTFSICCNITAGLIIAIGDRLSRKKEVLEKRMHQAITAEAIHRKHLEQKLAIRENTEPDDWMNAPEPATIKDIIKHKVASEEKYSEKNKAAEQILAAPVTGSVSAPGVGPSDWEWQDRRTSEELEEKHETDRKRAKEEKKREEKERLRRAAEAHGKALSQIQEDGQGERRGSSDRERRDSEQKTSGRRSSERRDSSKRKSTSERKSSERKDSARSQPERKGTE